MQLQWQVVKSDEAHIFISPFHPHPHQLIFIAQPLSFILPLSYKFIKIINNWMQPHK
jgi:hypothetical protein